MDKSDIKESLKTLLEENGGELGYWGEEIKLPEPVVVQPITKKAAPTKKPFAGGSKQEHLTFLKDQTIGDCHLCPLGDTRVKLVFGVGNPDAEVMFVGEGPGFDEDRKGEPFVGKAGQLLDKIMAAIQLDRTKVFIANVVKCHPMVNPQRSEMRGNDRPPTPKEMEKCLPFLKEQISIIQPKIIVTLGATATRALLNTTQGITRLRGKVQKVPLLDGKPPIPVLPTYHPAALLHDATLKRPVWEDMKLLRTFIEG